MIISTTIDLSPDIYRYFMDLSETIPDTTPEDMMSMVLTMHVINQRRHLTMTKAERDKLDRLRRSGKLTKLFETWDSPDRP